MSCPEGALMFQRFEIQGVHTEVDDSLRKYVNKKIGRLDRFIARHNRISAHAEVYLKESKIKNKKQCTCEVTLHLPKETINIEDSTLNMYAAVDIVEEKLKRRLQKYKDLHSNGKTRRHLFGRFRKRQA